PAEVLADAICAATGVPDQYPGYPLGLRAIQLPDPSVKSSFLALFGRSDRVTACACERGADVAMVHTLHLLTGDDVVRKIEAPEGTLARLLKEKRDPTAIVDELVLATFCRVPTTAERSRIDASTKNRLLDAAALGDLFWALVNSKEFVFNH